MLVTAKAAADAGDEPELYVINLCASTTPMALVQPKTEALRRFTFFVSRRREDGRERFRLHMGYFASPGDAEEWLAVVRELYPAAWVGEAPGKKLRAAARAAAAVTAPAPAEPATVAPVMVPTPTPTATRIAPVVARQPPVVVRKPPAVSPPAPRVVSPPPRPAPVTIPPAVAALSNVREVLAKLEATDSPAQAAPRTSRTPRESTAPQGSATPQASTTPPASSAPHVLYVPPPPVLPEHIPTVQALTPAPMSAPAPAAIPAAPKAATPKAVTPKAPAKTPLAPPLSDTQVLRVLEERRDTGPGAPQAPTSAEREANAAIELLRPEDTRTMRVLKEEVQRSAPMQFAVQLKWSVTPIDVAGVPPLAIFSAYTLYTVESTRDGRKWYGLRLGFFSDALSAKQVAYYVRSDFASVAVVPVTTPEKDHAIAGAAAHPQPVRKAGRVKPSEEFKLFDVEPVPAKPVPTAAQVRKKLAAAAQAGKRPAAGARVAAPRKKARTLEESLEQTLEILGASDLEIDKGRGELLNDTGVRHLSVKIDKRTSTFSKLLDRLSDRVGKS
ncbi:MAG: hypothetical protein AB7G76_09560 [Steroidobacteraceae bacterium]